MATERDTVFVSPFSILANIAQFLAEDIKAEDFATGTTPDELEYIFIVKKKGDTAFLASRNRGEEALIREMLMEVVRDVDKMATEVSDE